MFFGKILTGLLLVSFFASLVLATVPSTPPEHKEVDSCTSTYTWQWTQKDDAQSWLKINEVDSCGGVVLACNCDPAKPSVDSPSVGQVETTSCNGQCTPIVSVQASETPIVSEAPIQVPSGGPSDMPSGSPGFSPEKSSDMSIVLSGVLVLSLLVAGYSAMKK